MGDFTGAFAPKLKAKDESTIVKIFLDVLAFGIGISSAGLWNIGQSVLLSQLKAFADLSSYP